MEVRMIGDEIVVDGVPVGALVERHTREREALRDALANAPDLQYENGGPGLFGDATADELEDAKNELEGVESDIASLRRDVDQALEALRRGNIEQAKEILEDA